MRPPQDMSSTTTQLLTVKIVTVADGSDPAKIATEVDSKVPSLDTD
jgi:hypothetical protein